MHWIHRDEKNYLTNFFYYIPSLPSPSGDPYQVATEGDQSEPIEEYELTLTSFLGLKQKEGVTWNIESKPKRMSIWENACSSVRAILS